MSGKIKVLVVEPMKPCEVREIDGSLETMQAIVGGYIQAVYPFPFDEIALICNEEAKLMGLPYNRPLTGFGGPSRSPAKRVRLGEEEQGSERSFRRQVETEWSGLCDDEGVPYDIICGTFFLTGQGGEDFISLTDEQIGRYKGLYDNMMVLTAGKAPPKQKISEKKKEKYHER